MKIRDFINTITEGVEESDVITLDSDVEIFFGDSNQQRRLYIDEMGIANATVVSEGNDNGTNKDFLFIEVVPVDAGEALRKLAEIAERLGKSDLSDMEVEGHA